MSSAVPVRFEKSGLICSINNKVVRAYRKDYPEIVYNYYRCDSRGVCVPTAKPVDQPINYYCHSGYGGTVKKISDYLFSGEVKHRGKNLYFGMEKLLGTDEKWINLIDILYNESYQQVKIDGLGELEFNDGVRGLIRKLDKNLQEGNDSSDQKIQRYLGFTDEQFNKVKQRLREKWTELDSEKKPYYTVGIGIAGLDLVVKERKESGYVMYISKKPVERRFSPSGESFLDKYGDLIMCCGFVNNISAPTTTHYGIFKNPVYFLLDHEMYGGISLKLHGFGAKIALEYFEGKKYMVNQPVASMAQIMKRYLTPDEMWIGMKNFPSKIQKFKKKLMDENYPPILWDEKTIMEEGTDLSKFNSLPEDKIQYQGEGVDGSGAGLLQVTIVYKLEKLSTFYT